MKSIQTLILFFAASLVFMACNKVSMKKTKGGMPYQLYRGTGTVKPKLQQFLKVNYTQSIKQAGKDSIYFTTRGKIPFYIPVLETTNPYDVSELWAELRKGDSVIAIQMMDTFIKRSPGNVPPQFKNGDEIITTIRVFDIFENDSLARADEEKEKSKFLQNEIQFLAKYLGDKKVQAQQTPSGAFVQVTKPGEGNLIDSGKYASVNYTGTAFFSGKVFDSNTDTTFRHVEEMTFPVGTGQMIKGFDEAMRFLRPGAEARIYIPSMLAYGPRPQSPDIQPFEPLIFDIKVTGVNDGPPKERPQPQIKVDVPQRK